MFITMDSGNKLQTKAHFNPLSTHTTRLIRLTRKQQHVKARSPLSGLMVYKSIAIVSFYVLYHHDFMLPFLCFMGSFVSVRRIFLSSFLHATFY